VGSSASDPFAFDPETGKLKTENRKSEQRILLPWSVRFGQKSAANSIELLGPSWEPKLPPSYQLNAPQLSALSAAVQHLIYDRQLRLGWRPFK